MSGFAPLQFILTTFLPLLGLGLTVALLGYGAYAL
ncbi:hypothetical protein AVMA1855_01965 [Acidovorax sp. SUPP1855]|nr:hypothetical protein AVMA1855_01965 [Acidovorax sp. SUPP1855]